MKYIIIPNGKTFDLIDGDTSVFIKNFQNKKEATTYIKNSNSVQFRQNKLLRSANNLFVIDKSIEEAIYQNLHEELNPVLEEKQPEYKYVNKKARDLIFKELDQKNKEAENNEKIEKAAITKNKAEEDAKAEAKLRADIAEKEEQVKAEKEAMEAKLKKAEEDKLKAEEDKLKAEEESKQLRLDKVKEAEEKLKKAERKAEQAEKKAAEAERMAIEAERKAKLIAERKSEYEKSSKFDPNQGDQKYLLNNQNDKDIDFELTAFDIFENENSENNYFINEEKVLENNQKIKEWKSLLTSTKKTNKSTPFSSFKNYNFIENDLDETNDF